MRRRTWRVDRLAEAPLPDEFATDDVRFPENLVERCLAEFSQPGDRVLDPFAGFGTTAVVAIRMGREAVAIELLPERVAFIRSRVDDGAIVHQGDARQLRTFDLGRVDVVLTSPPYMTRDNHPQDPLSGYRRPGGNYERYLGELRDVILSAAALLPPGGYAIVNIANLVDGGTLTPLADDLRAELMTSLELVEEIRVLEEGRPSYVADEYCLVLRTRAVSSV